MRWQRSKSPARALTVLKWGWSQRSMTASLQRGRERESVPVHVFGVRSVECARLQMGGSDRRAIDKEHCPKCIGS